jgi:5'-nucleotidase / UDP-sugar diphosphatase
MRFTTLFLASMLVPGAFAQKPLTITILHTNDLHAHLEPTLVKGKSLGGYARHATIIKDARKQEKNTLLLNAGDCFQGTLYFNMYEGLADVSIMNVLGYTAMCVGNHEFDKGPKTLIEFAKRANFPVLAANLDATNEPELARLIKPSAIVEIETQKIGIVGLVTESTPGISSPGETLKFNDPVTSAQKAIDELTKQGINKIILVNHIGYDEDKVLAAKLRGVDVIVGGHSHTPLGTPAMDGWKPSGGPYPTFVKNADGQPAYVVQAWEWGKVFGKFKVTFDAKGVINKVNEATPIIVDNTIPEDITVASIVDAFRKPIEAMANERVGESATAITNRTQIGMIMADSFLASTEKFGAVAAFMNPGGVRANLEAGPIKFGAASSIAPFRNSLFVVTLTGAEIVQTITELKSIIPSRGVRFTLQGGGVRDVMIANQPIDLAKSYKVAVLSFMAGGGDGLLTLKNATTKFDTGVFDIDAFVDYLKKNSPIKAPEEIRVKG